jgi:arylsulfatase A-like enzyme
MHQHKNVVVFFTDQQRWDTSGLHGNPLELMPNYDRMARDGTHVFNSFTCQPVCGPSRACLQTGMYATATGCYRNGIALPSDAKTLAHHFRAAGYHTGYIGKWHLADGIKPVPKSKRGGYEYWLAANVLEAVSYPYDTVVFDNDGNSVKLPGYRVDALTDAAIRYLVTHKDHPFFLFISYLEPHQQNQLDDYPPPDGYRERYTGKWVPPDLAALGGSAQQHLGGYYGMVKRLDEALGRLLDALKSLGLDGNTIVLFTSDHGCHFKTRNNEYKRSCHESSIRVPTALQGPGFDGGHRIQELVSIIDLMPTLLDAAGLTVPDGLPGRSILPLIHGEQERWPAEVFIQISETQVGRAIRTHRWKYGVVAPDKDGWDDSAADHFVETYLYDLQADPYELTNLIGFESHQKLVAALRERLIKHIVAAEEYAPGIEPAAPRDSGWRRVTDEEVLAA